MKKILCLLLCLFMILLSSCNSESSEPCYYCGDTPTKSYINDSTNEKQYYCDNCSSTCAFCGEEAQKSYSSALDVIVFVCDDCYQFIADFNNPSNTSPEEDTPQVDANHEAKQHISTLEHINAVYQFENGLACVSDTKNNNYYFDMDGYVVNTSKGSLNAEVLYPGSKSLVVYNNDTKSYALIDFEGNTLLEFPSDKYSIVSSPVDGLVFAQEIKKELSGQSFDAVYYDELGNEVMRFKGKHHIGAASCFNEDHAFLCEISDGANEEYPWLKKDQPYNWVIVNKNGGTTPLKIVNDISEATVNGEPVVACEVDTVRPFCDGEVHTSAELSMITRSSSGGYRSYPFIGIVSKLGEVYVAHTRYTTPSDLNTVSDCVNNCIINIANGSAAIVNISEVEVIKVHEIEEFASAKISEVDFMDDGNFFVTLVNDDFDYFGAIIDSMGQIVEPPRYIGNMYRYVSIDYAIKSSRELNNEHNKLFEYCSIANNQQQWQNRSYYKSPVLAVDGLYRFEDDKDTSNKTDDVYGYCDLWGNIIIEPQYSIASDFKNGYAIVATENHSGSISSDHAGYNLTIIDHNGNPIQ